MSRLDPNAASDTPVIEELWLNYFNNYLLEHKAISEKEYRRMTEKIAEKAARYPSFKEMH